MSDWSSDVCSSDLFDPLIRDRKRTERLFGFHYRIEVFVPAPKRKYGYYVFPLLEGDRLIGRLDMKHERDNSVLRVKGLWLEPGQRLPAARQERLEAELERQRRSPGPERNTLARGWLRGDGMAACGEGGGRDGVDW